MYHMKSKAVWILVALVTAFHAPKPAAADVYFSTDTWYEGLALTAQELGSVTLAPLGSYQVAYGDFYGSWTLETQNDPFPIGPGASPQLPADHLTSRGFLREPGVVPGSLGALFTCYQPISNCVGAQSVTFTLPFEVLGFSGILDVGADYSPAEGSFLRELQVSRLPGAYWTPTYPDTFFGKLFDAPTNVITVTWGTSSDNSARFTISDVLLVMAPTAVPEPTSLAILSAGIFGLAALRRRVRRSGRGAPASWSD